ncbi:MAG: hypothetical protein ACTSVI_12245 [Promethearchaeota archaeon]
MVNWERLFSIRFGILVKGDITSLLVTTFIQDKTFTWNCVFKRCHYLTLLEKEW